MAMFKKYMEAIYTAPGTPLSSNNHRNQSKHIVIVWNKQLCCSVINTFQPFQLVAPIHYFISYRLYFVVIIKAQGQKP